MKNTIKKQATWETSTGAIVTVTAELALEKVINLDGDKSTVKCCEKSLSVHVEGHGNQGGWVRTLPKPEKHNGRTFVAEVGKLGLTEEQVDIIKGLESEITSTPEWQAKIAAEENNAREIAEMEARRARNGYCPKCHSYCYGDCSAN